MELLIRDPIHPIRSLHFARGTRILLWHHSVYYEWVGQFRQLLSSADHLDANLRTVAGPLDAMLTASGSMRPHLIVTGISSAALSSGTSVLREIRAGRVLCPIIVVTDSYDETHLFQLLDAGASDFLPSPFRKAEVLARLSSWSRTRLDAESNRGTLNQVPGLDLIKGESPAILIQIEKARRFAHSDAAVLISGETGTGKEIFARGIHQTGFRASKPFIAVNCGALPVDLVENELFGHQAGAFTGARTPHEGLIREAEGGTMFLDEIDSLPLPAQAKLLRFLQQHEYRPLGSAEVRHADVRIVSASNANLPEAVRTGLFRQDLYFRLSVLPLSLPALRERREDIPCSPTTCSSATTLSLRRANHACLKVRVVQPSGELVLTLRLHSPPRP